MKKTIAIVLGSFFLVGNVLAQGAPAGMNVKLEVVNVAQNNQNAESVGARPGDVLRYELTLNSETRNASGVIPKIDVSQLVQAADIIDAGMGTVSGDKQLEYPALSQAAPYRRTYSVFARVRPDCGSLGTMSVKSLGKTSSVQMTCDLANSGPGMEMLLILMLLSVGILVISFRAYRTD